MEFSITIARRQGVAPVTPITLGIAGGGFTIGRNPDNDLPLSDPERVISGRHARLDRRDGALWVTDLSTNGTFLNDSAQRLPAHQPVRLADGDTLSVGPYELVIAAGERATGTAPASCDDFAVQDHEELAELPGHAAAADILDQLDPTDAKGPSGAPVYPQCAPPAPADPFADALALDPLLAAAAVPAEAALATPPPTPFEHVHFRAPEIRPAAGPPTAPEGALVPDDYDLLADALGPAAAPVPGFAAPIPAAPQPPTAPPDQPSAGFAVAAARADSAPPAIPPTAPAATAPEPPPTPIAAPAAPAAADFGLDAFLAGLGSGDALAVADPQQFLHDAGRLLRELTQGLTATMQTRARFKSELRLSITTIRATDNNPFKFSVTADEALERLLFRPGAGFLGAVEAAREACEDIQAHEMAMIAGLRAALRALLARFAPAELERRLGTAKGLDALLPMARQSRYWDLFTEIYDQVAADASEDFMQLFGDAFVRAYEDQIQRLAQARRQRPVASGR